MIAFEGGYHGLDLGALAVTHRPDFRQPFLQWPGLGAQVYFVPFCETVADLVFHLDKAKDVLKERGYPCSSVLLEPIQGRAGGRAFPGEILERISQWTRDEGICLIFDEIFVGLGRTGRWSFSHEFPCDLVCLGKALGGGLPLSALVGRPEILDAWPENRGEALHTGTFFGHPLACEMALATLTAFEDLDLPNLCKNRGHKLAARLRAFFSEESKVLCEVRAYGLHLTLDFKVKGRGADLFSRLLEKGIITLPSAEFGTCVSLTPSAFLSEAEEDFFVKALAESIASFK